MQLAVVFSCLVLSLYHLQGNVRATVACNNGQLQCVDNATCTAGECVCLPGFKGDGRVFCAQGRCVCTGRGDTFYRLFDLHVLQLMLKVNLPCSVDLVRPPTAGGFLNVAGTCFINYITANSMVRPGYNPHDPAFRTFLSSLHLSGFNPMGGAFSAWLSSTNTTVNPPTLGTVKTVKFVTAQTTEVLIKLYIPSCDVHIGFSALYGEVFVSLPKILGSGILRGLCGNCNNITDIETVQTPGQQVAYFLRYLADNARQTGRFADQCRKFASRTRVATDCTDAELLNAGDTCGLLLGKFGRCLLSNGIRNETGLMHLFGTCVANGCDGQTRAQLCTLVQNAGVAPTCVLAACP